MLEAIVETNQWREFRSAFAFALLVKAILLTPLR
jgi:hypothetical protein